MFFGSGGLKSRLAKAAGAEAFGEMRDEKVHAGVARSRFGSQNVQGTPCLEHFWKLRCAHHCGVEHMWKSKCQRHHRFGPLLEVEMSKRCARRWHEADSYVKTVKTSHARTNFGSWDVEKVHVVVARSPSSPGSPWRNSIAISSRGLANHNRTASANPASRTMDAAIPMQNAILNATLGWKTRLSANEWRLHPFHKRGSPHRRRNVLHARKHRVSCDSILASVTLRSPTTALQPMQTETLTATLGCRTHLRANGPRPHPSHERGSPHRRRNAF